MPQPSHGSLPTLLSYTGPLPSLFPEAQEERQARARALHSTEFTLTPFPSVWSNEQQRVAMLRDPTSLAHQPGAEDAEDVQRRRGEVAEIVEAAIAADRERMSEEDRQLHADARLVREAQAAAYKAELMVLVATVEGHSLWVVPDVAPAGTPVVAHLPYAYQDEGRMQAALRALTIIGLDPESLAAAHGCFPQLRPLTSPQVPTYVLLMNKGVVDTALRAAASQGRALVTVDWRMVPYVSVADAFPESVSAAYHFPGLQAWAEASMAPWFIEARSALGQVATSSHHRPSLFPTAVAQRQVTTIPPSSVHAPPFVPTLPSPGVIAEPENPAAMYTPDSRAVFNEDKALQSLSKMITHDLPAFMEPGNKVAPLDALESFSGSLLRFFEHHEVARALSEPSCRPAGGTQTSIPKLLWDVAHARLEVAQRRYLTEMAPGGAGGSAWLERYTSVARFVGDLALSVGLTQAQLCELKPELIRDRQGSESAWSYHL
ncbi:hypothetical protein CYMTET_23506 [Cymbomonas tetramitiformis]|uniref:Uncharacterized protein n=1 Tax=Cymbomonas tetramitiformis TaxID=36881 RepID=A0AAE0FZ63_9CHLO|nr:hypothetical protein CYMTET_23506 [Cymbomonas tetramitiformis]